jgi:5-methyltetrahydropteroyltriglutamate--homocysteine methyltransferase
MNGMKRSSDRILTTHVGSLPRQPEVVEALVRKEKGESYDREKFDSIVRSGVADIVARQAAIGLDVVSDGETGKIGYSTYVRERLSGFGGEYTPKPNRDLADHPEFRRRMSLYLGAQPFRRVCCIGPVALRDPEAVHTDIANFRAALENASVEEGFLNAASPGVVASFLPNRYYPDHESYVQAVAAAMRHEYEAIASAGLVLQVDCPDLAMSRHTGFQDLSDEEFLRVAALNVEALNAALANVPASQVRIHICWGNYEGPHDHDIALDRIMPLIKKVKAGALVFEAANPRHEHEWTVWRDAKLPDDVVLVPGVLDTSSNYVEHPELIAQRIERYASFAGRERVMAGSDCGFGTFAGYAKVDPDIAVKKLRSLVEGAEIATQRLWH